MERRPRVAMIRALTNPAYLMEVVRLAARARRSILLVTYLAELSGRRGDPVLKVARALVGACRRGVKVQVILEGSRFENNYPFYRLLKRADADVWMDTSRTLIHQKAFLFDDRILVAGSHNLTAASLKHSEELSFATDDPGVVRVFGRALGVIEILRGVPKRRGRHYSEEAQYYRLNPLENRRTTSTTSFSLTRIRIHLQKET